MGDAQQGAYALVEQDGVDHVGGRDVIDDDRLSGGGHAAGEAVPDPDTETPAHLLLQALGRRRDEFTGVTVQQQNRRRVDLEEIPNPFEQLIEQLGDVQPRQGRIGD